MNPNQMDPNQVEQQSVDPLKPDYNAMWDAAYEAPHTEGDAMGGRASRFRSHRKRHARKSRKSRKSRN